MLRCNELSIYNWLYVPNVCKVTTLVNDEDSFIL